MTAAVIGVVTMTLSSLSCSSDSADTTVAPRIDTHMHLQGQGMSLDTAAGMLVEMMDERGVDVAIVQELIHDRTDYQDLLASVANHPGRLYVGAGSAELNALIQGTDPADVDDSLETRFRSLANSYVDTGAVVFGEMFGLHLCMSNEHNFQDGALDHPLFLVLADVAADRGVPIDLHTEAVPRDQATPVNLSRACMMNPPELSATIPPFKALLGHNPAAHIVWQHVGWDNIGHLTVELLRDMLAAHPNLYLAIRVEVRLDQVGDGGPMPNRIVDRMGNIKLEWSQLFSDYSDRIMVGSDEFVSVPGATGGIMPPDSFDKTWALLDQLDPELRRKIGHANAARVYGLR
ncbi:MAG TPA: amidohydrolase family protein [Dehalococcoidia bacterium]|nr:amidohydrolase family protein [Dehalococcoidia bacterium]